MYKNKYYSVGEASEICHISRKTLRFYDEIGLISPDTVGQNNYRYYSRKTLLTIPIIKYFKQMGFRLDEMKDFITGTSSYEHVAEAFHNKIIELEEEMVSLNIKSTSVKDWYSLIREARTVIEENMTDVSIKYVESNQCCYLNQAYNNDFMDAIINIEFTNFIENIKNDITGPVIIYYPSLQGRSSGSCESMKMIQRTILPCEKENQIIWGGTSMVSCYHIGSLQNISDTYDKIVDWSSSHGYNLSEGVYERYVTDYWTTGDEDKFVTEVLVGATR